MATEHIVVVEDEKDIANLMTLQLKSKGYQVTNYFSGEEALNAIQSSEVKPQLFILDRMLPGPPGTQGLDVCRFIRLYKETKEIPVLFVTAMTAPTQIVEGLEAGADDYVTKPFDLNVFAARVKALLRRSELSKVPAPVESNTYEWKGLKVNNDECRAFIDNTEIDLTLSEFKLLSIFLKCPGKVYTRSGLVEYVQDGPVHVTDRTIDTHIFGLRKKLGNHANLIETIRGVGYRVAND